MLPGKLPGRLPGKLPSSDCAAPNPPSPSSSMVRTPTIRDCLGNLDFARAFMTRMTIVRATMKMIIMMLISM